jgi:hemerythrin-like domain-containing protein
MICGGLATSFAVAQDPDRPDEPEEAMISPAEDLMREHGVLKRILLVYEEGIRRIGAAEDIDPGHLYDAASLVRSFVEDYHEKLEEDFLFPRFRRADTLVDLVDVLQRQHQAGRRLTDETLRLTSVKRLAPGQDARDLANSLQMFIRMYNPHEAREDTVLFPALRRIVSENEYAALGEDFEDKEHDLFGEDGFEVMVDRVATIEKGLGIFELGQFTPKI